MRSIILASASPRRAELLRQMGLSFTVSAVEIDAYCQTGEPIDKAGAYGIQGKGGIFVDDLWGSYSAVVGLPLDETAALLMEAGEPVWLHWSQSGEEPL